MRYLHVRKHTRLNGYDYSQSGCYFITICVKDRHEMLGKVVVGARLASTVTNVSTAIVELSEYGIIADDELKNISKHYENVSVDFYIVMPNHVHALICIEALKTGEASLALTPALGSIVGGYKSGVSRLCGFPLWQRSFHDHIIRNEEEYRKIWNYIDTNPAKWEDDCFFVKR